MNMIQKLIDECHTRGGGIATVPSGEHVCGTIRMRSNVELHIPAGASILGSQKISDYPCEAKEGIELIHRSPSLFCAENESDFSITGHGLIDGRGTTEAFPALRPGDEMERPMLMRFVNCKNVHLRDVRLMNSASWGCHFINSEQIQIHGIFMDSRLNRNNDGLDLDGCRDVFISNCRLITGDDSICPKSTARVTENMVVNNCIVSSHTAAFKLGTSSAGGFRNITLSNCIFRDCRMGAIKLLCVDGGILENILISDVVMDNVEGPIFIRLGSRGIRYNDKKDCNSLLNDEDWTRVSGSQSAGVLRHITIRNIRANVVSDKLDRWGIMISGVPGHRVQDIILRDIDISFPGGGTAEHANLAVPEDEKRYPEQCFFGVLPSWGIFIRHAEDVRLENVRLSLRGKDERPAIYKEDVLHLHEDNLIAQENHRQDACATF
jgi:polygalacturonase